MNAVVSPTKYPLPDLNQVKTLLGMLFDGMTVKVGGTVDLTPKSSAWCAVYVGTDNIPVALVACDVAFAANSGAALSMLPPNVAKDAVKTAQLTDVMIANLREVMNICTRLLLHDTSPHLRLESLWPASKLPATAAAVVGAAKGRVTFEIGLAKYGGGLLTVLAV